MPRAGGKQVGHDPVRLGPAPGFPRGAEGDQLRVAQQQLACGPLEELPVLRVGTWPAAFYVVDAEEVELMGDTELVGDREREALCLAAVAERRVEHLDHTREVGSFSRHAPPRRGSGPPGPGRSL